MRILIFGKTGSGKTYLTRNLINDINNCVVLDVFNEYRNLESVNVNDIDRYEKCRVVAYNHQVEDIFLDNILELENRTIIIEEIDRFCSPHYIDERLSYLVRYGRHKNLSLIGISRRPKEIHKHLTANANYIISFRMHEPNDLKYFREINDSFANSLQHLKQYEYKIQEM
jgi:DNA helicase HerA-like ATPase